MIEYTAPLLNLKVGASVGPTANVPSELGTKECARFHHGVVKSFEVNTNDNTGVLLIWPLLSYPGNNLPGSDGISLIQRLPEKEKNLFLPVPFSNVVKYVYVNVKEYLESQTSPPKFLDIPPGGIVDLGRFKSVYPAWIAVNIHTDVLLAGAQWVRLRDNPRVSLDTLDRLDLYYAIVRNGDGGIVEGVIAFQEGDDVSNDESFLRDFIDHFSINRAARTLQWVQAL